MALKVTVAKSTQSAIPELGKKENTLYYLVIAKGEEKVVINVGEKTYNSVDKLCKEDKLYKDEESKQENKGGGK